ncbi:MAG: hypothetical protein GEU96_12285 [Propionibacteriales bacterium]|nr:hypothetical protein [Propionibacteriales bacterium]
MAVGAGLVAVGVTVSASAPSAAADGLRTFDDCDALRDWYVTAALPQVTPYGLGGGHPYIMQDSMAMKGSAPGAAEMAAPQARSSSADAAVGNGETGTNVQEAGVDEPDLVKTDGRHVIFVRNGTLHVEDTVGDTPVEVGKVRLSESGGDQFNELLLVGDRAVVTGTRLPQLDQPDQQGQPDARLSDWSWPEYNDTVVSTVDLSDLDDPTLVRTEQLDGRLVSAREYDGVVRLVLSHSPDLPFVQPDRTTSEVQALAENRRLIRSTTAQDWLPQRGDEQLLDCSDVRHPKRDAGLGTVTVVTMSPLLPSALDAVGVSASGDLVYSSTDRLYVATTDGGFMPMAEGDMPTSDVVRTPPHREPSTQVHAFTLDGAATTYTASGKVPGRVHDRWAFSEHDGLLRVASMQGGLGRPQESGITVLEEAGGGLKEVGSVGGMGRNEQIRAVRWFGDLAVVVTFRQTDPLYTVDLSEPTRPRVRGELKIPGYSAYLHPIGDDLLLGVGQDATQEGQVKGVQVSSFDLTRLDRPTRVDTADLGAQSYTPVEQDSRAFSYLPERRLALVPVTDWTAGGQRMQVVAVSTDGALSQVDEVELSRRGGEQVRALPLDDGRVAIAGYDGVVELVDLPTRP